ncbi:MAG: hypothetical protein DRJ40_01140 [Thermoprotei archaeon]|nr:MAG: hypothetical protein DRJ40_01140 [Thermoprotei archaeon]
MKVLIIGGGIAGCSLAVLLSRYLPRVDITVVEEHERIAVIRSLLPYVVSDVLSLDDVQMYTREHLQDYCGVELLLRSTVSSISTTERIAVVGDEEIAFDILAVCTGPKVHGPLVIDDRVILHFWSEDSALELRKLVDRGKVIGVYGFSTLASTLLTVLRELGIECVLLIPSYVREYLDPDTWSLITKVLEEEGIKYGVVTEPEKVYEVDVIAKVELRSWSKVPNLDLGEEPATNTIGSTKYSNIYCVGRCSKVVDPVLGIANKLESDTFSYLHALYVALKLAGYSIHVRGFVPIRLLKLGKYIIALIGYTATFLRKQGVNTVASRIRSPITQPLPGKEVSEITLKLICDYRTQRLLGSFIAGTDQRVCDIAKLIAISILKSTSLQELLHITIGYNPELTNLRDPLVVATESLLTKVLT